MGFAGVAEFLDGSQGKHADQQVGVLNVFDEYLHLTEFPEFAQGLSRRDTDGGHGIGAQFQQRGFAFRRLVDP